MLLCGVFALLAPVQAQESSSPTAQYLEKRRASPILWNLTLEKLSQAPGAYKGKAFELEGTISGLSPTNDGGALVIFKVSGSRVLTLKLTRQPGWLQPGAFVRALCIITEGSEGSDEEIIGLPELEIVAVASAADISSLEARWKAEQEEKRKQQELQQRPKPQPPAPIQATPPAASASSISRGTLSSRSLPVKSPSTKKQIVIGPARYEDLTPGARAVFPIYRDFIRNHNKRLAAGEADLITYAILCYSEQLDMDPRLIVATVIAESDFKVRDLSRAGAMGLIQLMPDEVARLKLTNPYDPIQNIAAGIFLLKERLNKYSKSSNFADATDQQIVLTLASYNAGEGAVKRYGGVPPYKETQGYVKKIMRLYKELCGTK